MSLSFSKSFDRIKLASESPQRIAIMRELGVQPEIVHIDVDEVTLQSAKETVRANAIIKARASYENLQTNDIAVAGDTVLSIVDRVMGKPKGADDAVEQLKAISGKTIVAWSGVAAVCKDNPTGIVAVEATRVRIRELSESDIEWYVSTGEPLTRAGSFGISQFGEIFVSSIEGSYSCIAGLPKVALLAVLSELIEQPSGERVPILPPGLGQNTVAVETFSIDP